MFRTDLLFNSLRIPFSQTQKQAVLDWARDLHACDVPTLGALKANQQRIQGLLGNPTRKIESGLGNIFYINDVAHAIAKVVSLHLLVQCHDNLISLGLFQSDHTVLNARLSQRWWPRYDSSIQWQENVT